MTVNSMIRKANTQDIQDICTLLEQVLEVHHAGRPDIFRAHGKKYDEKALQEMLSRQGYPIFVYDDDGHVAGYIICQELTACGPSLMPVKTLYIDDLCVDKDARGKGIGRKLFNYAKDYAIENGFYNVTLRVWNSNPGAMRFYESLGLKPQSTTLELILGV